MKPPIEMLLDKLEWKPVEHGPAPDANAEIPHVTHSGVLDLLGCKMDVFRLSNGQTVISEESMIWWLGMMDGG